MMRRAALGFRLLSPHRCCSGKVYFRPGALDWEGAKDTASASSPSCRFKFRRSPPAILSIPTIARPIHAASIDARQCLPIPWKGVDFAAAAIGFRHSVPIDPKAIHKTRRSALQMRIHGLSPKLPYPQTIARNLARVPRVPECAGLFSSSRRRLAGPAPMPDRGSLRKVGRPT